MKINKEIIKHLDSKRAQRLEEAARQLLEKGDLERAREELTWINMSSQLLASIQKPPTRFIWSVIIALICLLIAGLAWTLHIPSTQISLELFTENVNMTLNKEWSLSHPFTTDEIYINNIVSLSAPGLNLHKTIVLDEYPFAIHLQGKEIIINELILKSNAGIELKLSGDKLKLFVKGSPMTGELFIKRADLLLELEEESIAKRISSEIPETISFRSTKTVGEPVLFELISKENWRLRGLHVREIGFLEEYPPGSGEFESVIHSGKVTLPETGLTKDLRKADRLILGDVKSSRFEISKADNKVKIFFEGSVAKILTGPKDGEKNLALTYLEYFYHQKRLAFFWSAVVFLWGVLWSIRNMIFK